MACVSTPSGGCPSGGSGRTTGVGACVPRAGIPRDGGGPASQADPPPLGLTLAPPFLCVSHPRPHLPQNFAAHGFLAHPQELHHQVRGCAHPLFAPECHGFPHAIRTQGSQKQDGATPAAYGSPPSARTGPKRGSSGQTAAT